MWPAGNFTVKIDQRLCDYDKFQKLHMPCSHAVAACKEANHEYRAYVHLVYTLESVQYEQMIVWRIAQQSVLVIVS